MTQLAVLILPTPAKGHRPGPSPFEGRYAATSGLRDESLAKPRHSAGFAAAAAALAALAAAAFLSTQRTDQIEPS